MANGYRPVSDSWSAAEWAAAYERAAAYLAKDPRWVVGPAVVKMYLIGLRNAEALEADRAG